MHMLILMELLQTLLLVDYSLSHYPCNSIRTNYEIKKKTLKAGVMLYSFSPPLLVSVPFLNIVFDIFLFHFLSKHLVIMN